MLTTDNTQLTKSRISTSTRRNIVPMAQLTKHSKHSSSSPSLISHRRASSTSTCTIARRTSSTPSPSKKKHSMSSRRIIPSININQVNQNEASFYRSPINPSGSISPLKELSKTPSPKFNSDCSFSTSEKTSHRDTQSYRDSFSFNGSEIEEDITVYQSVSVSNSMLSNPFSECYVKSKHRDFDSCNVYSPEKENQGQVPEGASPPLKRHRPTHLRIDDDHGNLPAWNVTQNQELIAFFSEQNLDHLLKQRDLLWSQLSEIRRREEQLYSELRSIDERIGGALLNNRTRAKVVL